MPEGRALLELCEAARGLSPARTALLLLTALDPSLDPAEAMALDLGARDARLLEARARCFGDGFEAAADCPACGTRLDVALSARALRQPEPPHLPPETANGPDDLAFRLPTSEDLLAVEAERGPAAMKRALLERCLLHGEASPAAEALVSAGLEAAMPQSDVSVALACPDCGHDWELPFDVTLFLLDELEGRAGRLLADVHLLASAYHWEEATILDMPASRRGRYVSMVSA
ncbi:hypothetical protein [Roseomonas populi]|uniref:Phage baseplate protein n=1 Tax=Roseomonas populi TaxID=3121582 RepID=A0ABT1X4U9_9PROT|nr:hypothetical protein [Roseomonas pecuniae]MCR0982749.1 hypothetical protein [Roseomonas pecuniae]